MVFWDSNMAIQSLILIVWLSGRLSLEILQMEQPSLSITSLLVESQSGSSNLVLSSLCLMVWMGRDLNIVREESKDFYIFQTIAAMNNRNYRLISSLETVTYR